MTGPEPPSDGLASRRAFLAAAGSGVALTTSGCTELLTDVSSDPDRLSVTITAVPDDDDRQVNGIFQYLESMLERVGIDVSPELRATDQFEQAILLDNDFDLYIGRYPGSPSPDSLYELLHSRFHNEPGWQNPFGFTDPDLDNRLQAQRTLTGDDRRAAIEDIFDAILTEKPFIPLCLPEAVHVVNPDQFTGWERASFRTRMGYLGLEPAGDTDRFSGLLTDARPALNLNPLAVNFRTTGAITGLLYDSLGTRLGGDLQPWLARGWEWADDTLTVDLRPEVTFHDGTGLDADDVAFTYDFLADLSLEQAESPVPATRFRRQLTAIDSVSVVDDEAVEFTVSTSREVAASILSVPILPEHVWRDFVEDLDQETVRTAEWLREDLQAEVRSRVGSGPYRFADWVEGDVVNLERFDEHFSIGSTELPSPPAPQLQLRTVPNGSSAVDQVETGDGSATVRPLEAHIIDDTDDLGSAERTSQERWAYYHVGFNIRRPPFSNPHFRRAVARLIDREFLVDSVFDGNADPITVPAIDSPVRSEYEWDGAAPQTPFEGEDGELDVEAAREWFREGSYRYDDDDRLVVNN